MSKVPISVSMFDIEYVINTAGKSLEDFSQEEINNALHEIGFQVQHIEIEECLHRPFFSPNNEPWKGKRFVSFERQDTEWLRSGKATLENIIYANEDETHKLDLLMMSQRATPTADIIDHISVGRTSEGE